MDTEEHIEIQKAIRQGHPPTDEGPYYHEPWWESYKGGVKGYLGGAVAYTGVGLAMGLAAAAILTFAGVAAAGAFVPIVAGFGAAGLLYGAHEFHNVGQIVGSGAAIAEKQEERTNSKFAALERKIDDLKSMISGKKTAAVKPSSDQATEESTTRHRTTHISDHNDGNRLVFWKIAAIGLAVGLAAGAMLVFGGATEHILGAMGAAKPFIEHSGLAIITAMGLFGASFGINRDIFRRVFDKTDLWFKGLVGHGLEPTKGKAQYAEKSKEKTDSSIVTVVYPQETEDCPASETHFRDKRKAELALLKLDPSRTMRQ